MATMTKTRKESKAKVQRSMKVSKPINGIYSLALTDSRGQHDAYFLEPVAADWGRAFKLHKVLPVPGEDAAYDIHIDDELGDSCTCKGCTYKDHCKHQAAIRKMIELGILPATAANHVPAETEQPEYATCLADLQGGF